MLEERLILAQLTNIERQLQENRKVVNDKIDDIKDDVTEIKSQVTQTNGRVTALERWQSRMEGAKMAYGWVPAAVLVVFSACLTYVLTHV